MQEAAQRKNNTRKPGNASRKKILGNGGGEESINTTKRCFSGNDEGGTT